MEGNVAFMKMLTTQVKMRMIILMIWGLGTIDRQLKVVGRNANTLASKIGIVDFSHMLFRIRSEIMIVICHLKSIFESPLHFRNAI